MSLLARLFGATREGVLPGTNLERARAALEGAPCSPVGVGNEKTDLPSTYRQVGVTCPSTCPFAGAGCYAEYGRVALQQKRATAGAEADLRAVAVALAVGARHGVPIRLHVSGDLLRDGRWDEVYIQGLQTLGREAQGLSGLDVVAYGYTHSELPGTDTLLGDLRRAGVLIRRSDHLEAGGAVVAPFTGFGRLKAQAKANGVRVMRCRALLQEGVTCRTCQLCWSRPEVCVVLDPHGPRERALKVKLEVK